MGPDRGPMAEMQAAVITPFPPIHLPTSVRLRKLHHQQSKATVADVPLDRPVDLVVLATETTGTTCRLQGREGVLTLRADPSLDVVRCLDAHAHLGAFHFERRPARALLHYHVGVGIGRLSLGPDFGGVLPWGCLGNRPYLRCLHGAGRITRTKGSA